MPTEPTPTAAGKTIPRAAKPPPKAAPKKAAPTSAHPAGMAAPANAAGVSAADWALVQKIATKYKIDPYILVAIGIHETGWGTLGDGRNGNILGVGSYDSGSTYKYAGLQNQLEGAAKILQGNGVHSIADIAAGKLAPADGKVKYASSPAWSSSIINVYNQVAGTKFTGAVSSAVSSGATATAHATPQQVKDTIAKKYGYLAGFLDDPEIGPILLQAAKEGWDSSRLNGAVYATRWYKTHAAVTRTFDSQSKLDPATQSRQIMAQADDIMAQAKRSGIILDHTALSKLAWTSLRYGWSGQQLTNAIVAQGKMDLSGKSPNGALTTADNLKEAAAQYMVPVSQQSLLQWTKQIQAGQMSVQDFNGYLKEQAKSLFPALSGAIDRGVTVEQYADPYRQQAAQTLEVDPQSIDFMHDPKYQKALFQIDPKTKDRTAMSLADWGTYLRGLPEFAKTAQANQQAAGMASSILKTFGEVAG